MPLIPVTTMTYHFNSHPHEEDDGNEFMHYIQKIISTHILTKRMTLDYKFTVIAWNHFNSHPHEEDDRIHNELPYNHEISTHILTKRMTTALLLLFVHFSHFNSHPHEEDDSNFKQNHFI